MTSLKFTGIGAAMVNARPHPMRVSRITDAPLGPTPLADAMDHTRSAPRVVCRRKRVREGNALRASRSANRTYPS